MEKSDVLEKVINAIESSMNLPDDIELNENTKLVADLDADSVDFVTLLIELEEEFECKIQDESAKEISDGTIGEIVEFIMKLKS